MLQTAPLSGEIWLTIAALALPLLVVPELLKTVLGARQSAAAAG
jgi:hypothetical protein